MPVLHRYWLTLRICASTAGAVYEKTAMLPSMAVRETASTALCHKGLLLFLQKVMQDRKAMRIPKYRMEILPYQSLTMPKEYQYGGLRLHWICLRAQFQSRTVFAYRNQ